MTVPLVGPGTTLELFSKPNFFCVGVGCAVRVRGSPLRARRRLLLRRLRALPHGPLRPERGADRRQLRATQKIRRVPRKTSHLPAKQAKRAVQPSPPGRARKIVAVGGAETRSSERRRSCSRRHEQLGVRDSPRRTSLGAFLVAVDASGKLLASSRTLRC